MSHIYSSHNPNGGSNELDTRIKARHLLHLSIQKTVVSHSIDYRTASDNGKREVDMPIELDMTRLERDFGIGCDREKAIIAIQGEDEPEIIFKPVEIFIDETIELDTEA